MLNEVVTFEFNCNAKYASTSVKQECMSLVLSFLLLGCLFEMFGVPSKVEKDTEITFDIWGLVALVTQYCRK